MTIISNIPKHPSVQARTILLLISVVVIATLSFLFTGFIIPQDSRQALIFQGGFLLVVFGSLLLEDKFTKPADGVVNAIAALISLTPVFTPSVDIFWWILCVYSLVVLLTGLINLFFSTKEIMEQWRVRLCRVTYEISTTLGKSNVIFSVIFVYAVFSFYGLRSDQTAVLMVFWGIYIALWPLKIPHLLDAVLQAILFKTNPSTEQGIIVRVEVPDIIKVRVHKNGHWSGSLVASLGDGHKRKVLPLYTQVQDEVVIGTGLLLETTSLAGIRTISGSVIRVELDNLDNQPHKTTEPLVGIVIEGSRIAKIQFETWQPKDFREGVMVYCQIKDKRIYYQVTDAATTQEPFERHRHGFQVVEAHQLGTFHHKEGFKKFPWLPEMNAPVFLAGENVQGSKLELGTSAMSLGLIPGSDVEVVCDIDDMISHHTAILGVTGSGKTELALRIIQKAIDNGVKVFCVDITGQYIGKLTRFSPQELSIDTALADELGQKLHDVETGSFGAGGEKKVLKEFENKLRQDIDNKVNGFINSNSSVGIFTMPSISNTKATIQATEIYLSSIFKYGRESTKESHRILVVLEEAHTVIPESSTMGLGDYDSRGMVAKIAQIALQGRKYQVGLLVISQRTATVSKTVLTQCNTVITFSSFDQTGQEFLLNIYGAEHTSKISNLPFFHALVFGKGIRSERPVVVELPYDKTLEYEQVNKAKSEIDDREG